MKYSWDNDYRPIIAGVMTIATIVLVKETPEEAGFSGIHEDEQESPGLVAALRCRAELLQDAGHATEAEPLARQALGMSLPNSSALPTDVGR